MKKSNISITTGCFLYSTGYIKVELMLNIVQYINRCHNKNQQRTLHCKKQKYQTKKEKVTFGYTVEVFITLS